MNTDNQNTVSIVIRIRNEAAALEKLFQALRVQTLQPLEVVVVDNDSTDGSREVALKHGAKLVDIPKSQFTYGRALNYGIRECTAKYIVLLSAHALPLGREFLEKVIAPFFDPRVAATRCMLVSKFHELENWMEPSVLEWPVDVFNLVEKGPIASGCAIRKDLWDQVPFDEKLEAVEDKFWAGELLKKGYVVVRSEAMYLHTRRRRLLEGVRIMNRERLEVFRTTGYRWPVPRPSMARLLKAIVLSAPRAALNLVAREALIYFYLKTIPLQARRKHRVGSIV